ncbi:PREDICTED: uncharacterized protein LOC105359531 [Ceratosolen solmsi marchali]|uniref:Uncharacterized protein LOC105359531 n=1 Tax=Ceratosolen solmsi marchali TaxID=326594 RepID=A0AAJ6YBL1_9HYME|nr:PREDICTED: uncharacterized protein LOC105359531 [Ceratosolen solmsi marchali]
MRPRLSAVFSACILAATAVGLLVFRPPGCRADNETEAKLAKLVKIFSKPGAFSQINAIFGEEEAAAQPSMWPGSSCVDGEEGLECRRAEARRSVDCPRGDCYCYNCSKAGPELWASCCRESLKCCSHLAAACRTCDQPPLYPFCAKHFKKCSSQLNDKKSA